ncbi:hypothetical protein [Desulfopila inferna]|uniref:hypothetical protein n=1 Tax=Desulfopila inferna TaxID=468528 RepID=UPI00338FAAB6
MGPPVSADTRQYLSDYAIVPAATQHLLPVFSKTVEIQMAMRVNELHVVDCDIYDIKKIIEVAQMALR